MDHGLEPIGWRQRAFPPSLARLVITRDREFVSRPAGRITSSREGRGGGAEAGRSRPLGAPGSAAGSRYVRCMDKEECGGGGGGVRGGLWGCCDRDADPSRGLPA